MRFMDLIDFNNFRNEEGIKTACFSIVLQLDSLSTVSTYREELNDRIECVGMLQGNWP